MSYVAPVAASYGISLQMVAAATEVLANAGIKGSRSGTGLRRTLTALFSDSEKADTALGNLGVHVNTLAQDMDQEFLRVLKELNKATNGATTNVGELNTAVGIYAIPTCLLYTSLHGMFLATLQTPKPPDWRCLESSEKHSMK